MGGDRKGIIFDFHTEAGCQDVLLSKSCAYALGQPAENGKGFLLCSSVFCEGDGITDSFCFGGGGQNRRIIDAVFRDFLSERKEFPGL